jgi:hypothetical protein
MQIMSRATVAAAAVLAVAVADKAALHADMPPARPALASGLARQQLPDGPGKEVLAKLCSGCHDLMFTLSTRETEEQWTRIVNDMRSKGADGTEEDFAKVIAYLTAHMGKAEPSEGHARFELLASRTKVAPGERFALGWRLVAADGWQLRGDATSGRSPQVSWTLPPVVTIGEPARRAADAPSTLTVFPGVVSTSAAPGSTLDFTARVTYEACRETCLTENATASMRLPVGDGGVPSHEEEFARAGVASRPPP